MTEVALPEQILLPTGELILAADTAAVAVALDELRQLRAQIDRVSRELRLAVQEASRREGTKTLRFGNVEAVVKSSETTTYDAEKIEAGLRKAGMSEERIREVVLETVTYKVDAVELKKAAGANPAYDRVMRRHRTVEERTPDVEVRIARAVVVPEQNT